MPGQTKDGGNTPNNAMRLLIEHIFLFFFSFLQYRTWRSGRLKARGSVWDQLTKPSRVWQIFSAQTPHVCYYDLTCFISTLWVSSLLFS